MCKDLMEPSAQSTIFVLFYVSWIAGKWVPVHSRLSLPSPLPHPLYCHKSINCQGAHPHFQLILCSIRLMSVFWEEPAF